MTISAFCVMNPVSTISMVDTARWRPVVYADTPRTLARFKQFIDSNKPDQRKTVLFLFGASYLNEALKHKDRFNSILVFDDLNNLHTLCKQVSGVQIVDIDKKDGVYPKYLTPSELMDVINQPTSFPESAILTHVTKALGQRRPSVLETTSRLPVPEAIPESGSQRLLSEIKKELTDDLPFAVVLDVYVKYLFRIVSRASVTKDVTKKLPTEAKELWKKALDFADSPIGEQMAKAYHAMCRSNDPDYRVGYVVGKFGLKAYAGDFLYFTSVLPPHKSCEFLPGTFSDDSKEDKPLVALFKAPEPPVKASKARAQKSKT